MPKILLVEDNEMNRDMLSRRLIRNGYEVSTAVDGQQGTDMALSERPDLILMDMSLPVVDGDRERAMEAGCEDYDTKPVEISRLLGKIAALLKSSAG